MCKRGSAPKDDAELRLTLSFERRGLYAHLMSSTRARTLIAEYLFLNTNSINAIKNAMEKGTLQDQVSTYDRLFQKLEQNGLYNKSYGYYPLGFRFVPDNYWLSALAKSVLYKFRI